VFRWYIKSNAFILFTLPWSAVKIVVHKKKNPQGSSVVVSLCIGLSNIGLISGICSPVIMTTGALTAARVTAVKTNPASSNCNSSTNRHLLVDP